MKKSELRQIIREELMNLHESGISLDSIADYLYGKLKSDKNWEKKAKTELKLMNIDNTNLKNIMNMLRGEDYFDIGEIEFN